MLSLYKNYGKFQIDPSGIPLDSDNAVLVIDEDGLFVQYNAVFYQWITQASWPEKLRSLSAIVSARYWRRFREPFLHTIKTGDTVQFPLNSWRPCVLDIFSQQMAVDFSIRKIRREGGRNFGILVIRKRTSVRSLAACRRSLTSNAETMALPNARILLVEDSPDNKALMECYFKNTPLEMDHAENGLVALEKVRTRHYHLVLMDLQMPVMDGYTAAYEIRRWELEQENLPRLPIYALSAFTLRENVERALAAGMDGHFAKPIRRQVLLREIGRIFQIYRFGFWNSIEASAASP